MAAAPDLIMNESGEQLNEFLTSLNIQTEVETEESAPMTRLDG